MEASEQDGQNVEASHGEDVLQPTASQDISAQNSYAAPVGQLEPEQGEPGYAARYAAQAAAAQSSEAAVPAAAAAVAQDHEPVAEHMPGVSQEQSPPVAPIQVPRNDSGNVKTLPSKLPKVKSANSGTGRSHSAVKSRPAPDLSKNWNPHVGKPVDTSLALKQAGPRSPSNGAHDGHKSSSAVTSPSRAERIKRKGWAEAAAKRQAEAARRLLELDAKSKAEVEARMEARKAAVRARIEQEKEAQARLAAKRLAVMRPPDDQGAIMPTGEQTDTRHAMRKRAASPRPLYIRLAEDYERKQAQEDEEVRKKLEMQAAIRQVRVQALMNGEVIIRPIEDYSKPQKDETAVSRWNPSCRPSVSPSRDHRLPRVGGLSPHRGTSLNGDYPDGEAGAEPTSPSAPRGHGMHKAGNGMVLYSMQDEDNGADSGNSTQSPLVTGGAQRRGKLVTRREREAGAGSGNGRFNNAARRGMMIDRAVSPFILDPATQQPTNAPSQEQFWPQKSSNGDAAAATPAAPGSARRLGALEQAPPPPPASRLASKAGPPNNSASQHEAAAAPVEAQPAEEASGILPSDEQLQGVIGGEEQGDDDVAAAGLQGSFAELSQPLEHQQDPISADEPQGGEAQEALEEEEKEEAADEEEAGEQKAPEPVEEAAQAEEAVEEAEQVAIEANSAEAGGDDAGDNAEMQAVGGDDAGGTGDAEQMGGAAPNAPGDAEDQGTADGTPSPVGN